MILKGEHIGDGVHGGADVPALIKTIRWLSLDNRI
jgi:hypothetical protein